MAKSTETETQFATIEEAIEDIRRGRMVVVCDDENRENEGDLTGISAADRARTVQVAIDPHSQPQDLVQPGHVFPLKAKDGGVLERTGQTEAAVDLARLAGLIPAGGICEIMNEDGTMARVPDLVAYCERHGLKMITVADLIAYRRRTEKLIEQVVATRLPTAFGEFS